RLSLYYRFFKRFHAEKIIASATVFGPILEEFVFRGILQGVVFENSWLGLVLTASLFSFLHAPYDFPSFIYYLFGGFMLGFA
ncbi:CPBP family intramembrane metalloprotease, partial [Burkholderia contaminans]|nr:CPBP family intramembrane metalloprotease [Burkholderia contaminans]